ncbi:M48 family metallopeptidase [Tepidamorphus sp. 3E244]|uniref:M48 family metallopeptidase n=1 Tax=Tepidamorphus sp. 3E244 TaxID=3385498 RepID=UPI0038FC500B
MTSISGNFFRPGTATSQPATLERDGTGEGRYTVTTEAGDIFNGLQIARTSERLPGVVRAISFTDANVFHTRDDDAVDALLGGSGGFSGWLLRTESSLVKSGIIAVLTVLLIIGVFRYGTPALAYVGAHLTPLNVMTAMDAGVLATLERATMQPTKLDEETQARLTARFDELVQDSGFDAVPLRLHFRDGGRIGANAIALPGGSIVMTDQLVARSKHDGELAGVLAHEIAHVEKRHSLQQIYRLAGVWFMLGVIGGDAGQIVESLAGTAVAFSTLSYARGFETEADMRSAELMVAANADPLAFIDLIDRVTKHSEGTGLGSLVRSHPGRVERRAAVCAHLKTLIEDYDCERGDVSDDLSGLPGLHSVRPAA